MRVCHFGLVKSKISLSSEYENQMITVIIHLADQLTCLSFGLIYSTISSSSEYENQMIAVTIHLADHVLVTAIWFSLFYVLLVNECENQITFTEHLAGQGYVDVIWFG